MRGAFGFMRLAALVGGALAVPFAGPQIMPVVDDPFEQARLRKLMGLPRGHSTARGKGKQAKRPKRRNLVTHGRRVRRAHRRARKAA